MRCVHVIFNHHSYHYWNPHYCNMPDTCVQLPQLHQTLTPSHTLSKKCHSCSPSIAGSRQLCIQDTPSFSGTNPHGKPPQHEHHRMDRPVWKRDSRLSSEAQVLQISEDLSRAYAMMIRKGGGDEVGMRWGCGGLGWDEGSTGASQLWQKWSCPASDRQRTQKGSAHSWGNSMRVSERPEARA